jgi:hypothetical protein
MITHARRGALAAAVLALGAVAGCYDNVGTSFDDTGVQHYPDGAVVADLSPFETPNLASLPAATATDPCPEMLNLVQAPDYMGASNVHGAACVHAPLAMVWTAIQDPEVAHDPTSTNSFMVIRPPMTSECDGVYESQLNAGNPFSVDFRLCWRLGVAMGTDAAPLLVRARWQKVWGTSAISRLEGSVVAMPLEGHPDISAVFYQYHLHAATTGPTNVETITAYLNQIYSRLVMRSHGTML